MVAVAVQTTSECACVADLVGARILVGNVPWTGPASATNYTVCAQVKGIVRGQRQLFTCAAVGGSPPTGQYIAIWRPSAAKKQLTLCEVDVVFGPEAPAQGADIGSQQQQQQPPAGRRRRLLAGLGLGRSRQQ